jgi:hypothetical protein
MPTLVPAHPALRLARLLPAAVLLLGTSVALIGCDANPDETAAECPKFRLLPHDDGATLLRYTPRGTDLTDLILSGHITDVKGACIGLLGGKEVKAKAHVVLVLTRGPAATSPDVDVRYSMGVVKKGEVLGQPQTFTQRVQFPSNVDTVQVDGQEVDFTFPTPKGTIGPDYQVYVYFQLTPAELALAHRRR